MVDLTKYIYIYTHTHKKKKKKKNSFEYISLHEKEKTKRQAENKMYPSNIHIHTYAKRELNTPSPFFFTLSAALLF